MLIEEGMAAQGMRLSLYDLSLRHSQRTVTPCPHEAFRLFS
jgi:hypothetical protein